MPATDRTRGRADSVVLRAAAKLTRRLSIVGRRPDGYHLLEAEMVTVDLYDELTFSAGDGFEVVDEVDWLVSDAGTQASPPAPTAAGQPELARSSPSTETSRVPESPRGPNLVERALEAVGRSASVRLVKRIPTGAGLGGGSADAAAVLRWARSSDRDMAVRLGSDVPFCMIGGRALVGGIGEIVEPLPYLRTDVLLVIPRLHVSTPEVYAAWDLMGGPVGSFENDLEPAALAVEPRLAWWRDLVANVSGHRPRLAGSGGTWWIDGDDALPDLEQAVSSAVVAARESAVVRLVRTIPAASVA